MLFRSEFPVPAGDEQRPHVQRHCALGVVRQDDDVGVHEVGLGARRVWLHTCTLDNPAALPNYLKRGFVPVKTEIVCT